MDISYQLYSSRDGANWADTFAMLARAGYTQVEGFGGVYDDPAATRDLLDRNGLAMPSGHFFPAGAFETGFKTTLATAQMLGMDRLFCPAPEESLRAGADERDWLDLALRLESAAKRVQDAGLRFGWHNHHWEFMPLADGTVPMRVLLDEAPSIEWEMDVAWVVKGGANPLDWIATYGPRISTVHVKDIAPEGDCADEDGWADLGQGTLDWAALTSALRGAGADLFVMEHDKPSDHTRFAQRSAAAFREL